MDREPVQIPLEKHLYAAMEHASIEVLEDAKLEIIPDIIGGLTVAMRKKIFTHHLASWEACHEVPANWWQHLRMQLGLRHKTRLSYAKIDRYRTYPHYNIVLPENRVGISYLQEEVSTWETKPK